jgi:polar amino acid transport system permease protein
VKFRKADAVLLVGIGLGLFLLFGHGGYVLNYHWKWEALPHFIARWDEEAGHWVPNLLLSGLLATIKLTIWGSVVSLVAGITVGMMRLSPALGLRLIGTTFVEAIRNVPPLVFVFIVYFFLSTQIVTALGLDSKLRDLGPVSSTVVGALFCPPEQLASFLPGVLALGLFSAAYVAEIVRAGIQSIDRGQWEAAKSLGFGRTKTFRHVVMPQALARMWGPLSNEFILLLKFSSLASLVSVPELTFQAYQVGVTTRGMFEVWILVGAIYFVLSASLAAVFSNLERRSRKTGR